VASYSLFIKPSAAKEIEALPKADRLKIVLKIQSLADNPRPPGHDKLSGDDKYRVRQGSCRILYTIDGNELIVSVVKVGHRREVYRK
jgi:mRNA interferase RelE/StbE